MVTPLAFRNRSQLQTLLANSEQIVLTPGFVGACVQEERLTNVHYRLRRHPNQVEIIEDVGREAAPKYLCLVARSGWVFEPRRYLSAHRNNGAIDIICVSTGYQVVLRSWCHCADERNRCRVGIGIVNLGPLTGL